MKILVLGGNGFIGRNIVNALKNIGTEIIIGSRYAKDGLAGIRQVRLQDLQTMEQWLAVLQDIDYVINCVGILRERSGETYYAIHNKAPTALAVASASLGIPMLHISALGLLPSAESRFIKSKYAGEQAIIATGAKSLIVRVPLLDGEGGYGSKWFRRVAKWPLQFVMQSKGLVAPLQVTDLAEAVANIVVADINTLPQVIELGGESVLTINDYLTTLRQAQGLNPAVQIRLPKWLVRLSSHLFDLFAWTPLSFGHYELMQGYNVPAKNSLPVLLKRKPAKLGLNVVLSEAVQTDIEQLKARLS